MIVKMRSVALAAVVIFGFAASENLVASTCPSAVIAYQASGLFGQKAITGPDGLKLAGEPFSITLYVCETRAPTKTSSDYADYAGLVLKGYVKSGLETAPTTIDTDQTSLLLVRPAAGHDMVELTGSATTQAGMIGFKAAVALPAGTLTTTSIAPFSKVSIITASSVFIYSYAAWRPSNAYSVGAIVDRLGTSKGC